LSYFLQKIWVFFSNVNLTNFIFSGKKCTKFFISPNFGGGGGGGGSLKTTFVYIDRVKKQNKDKLMNECNDEKGRV
jgi:hypothetical protein